jgi:hypothetical protein
VQVVDASRGGFRRDDHRASQAPTTIEMAHPLRLGEVTKAVEQVMFTGFGEGSVEAETGAVPHNDKAAMTVRFISVAARKMRNFVIWQGVLAGETWQSALLNSPSFHCENRGDDPHPALRLPGRRVGDDDALRVGAKGRTNSTCSLWVSPKAGVLLCPSVSSAATGC